jgi:hypothetical protein
MSKGSSIFMLSGDCADVSRPAFSFYAVTVEEAVLPSASSYFFSYCSFLAYFDF